MFSMKTRKMWALALTVLITLSFMSMFITVSADEEAAPIDLTVAFDANAENAEDYKAAASDFIDNYSDNVSTDAEFTTALNNALEAKRDDVKPFATGWALLPPVIAIVLALITKEVYQIIRLFSMQQDAKFLDNKALVSQNVTKSGQRGKI